MMKWHHRYGPGYARRSYLDYLTPEGRAKVGIAIACVGYLIGFFVAVSL